MIQKEQKRTAESQRMNLITIATFFSGITATVLQFTFEHNETRIEILVNVFFFLSIVFSISSAANGLLVIAWRRTPM